MRYSKIWGHIKGGEKRQKSLLSQSSHSSEGETNSVMNRLMTLYSVRKEVLQNHNRVRRMESTQQF